MLPVCFLEPCFRNDWVFIFGTKTGHLANHLARLVNNERTLEFFACSW